MADTSAPASTPAPSTTPAVPSTDTVSSLMNSTAFRNDVAFLAGVGGAAVGVIGHIWHMPVAPETVLVAGGALLATASRVVHTIVHGGLSKTALTSDAAQLKSVVPELQSQVNTLLPFVEKDLPLFKDTVVQAAADAKDAKSLASSLESKVADLPKNQAAAAQQILSHLQTAVATTPVPAVPPAPVDTPATPAS